MHVNVQTQISEMHKKQYYESMFSMLELTDGEAACTVCSRLPSLAFFTAVRRTPYL